MKTRSTDPSPAVCTHDGGVWPGLATCADCGGPTEPTDPSPDRTVVTQKETK